MPKLWFGGERKFDLSICNISTLKAPISMIKVSMFKLTIEERFKNGFGIQAKFSSLGPIKSVSFFWTLGTVKPRKQEHRTYRLIFVKKTPEDMNQKQSDFFPCSYQMIHL